MTALWKTVAVCRSGSSAAPAPELAEVPLDDVAASVGGAVIADRAAERRMPDLPVPTRTDPVLA
jgi:hypothetical protein